jgi:adenosylcobinamide kinase/adenosylcobinamide-phosphate guanylyltransferase
MKTGSGRSRVILVLGGASSGKSERALQFAGRARPRVFLATGEALDSEMTRRIERHKASRTGDWHTAEVPVEVTEWFNENGKLYQCVVLDCLTLWLSNLMRTIRTDGGIEGQVTALLRAIRATGNRVVIVSNELGLGLVPVGRAVRRFREVAGKVNQQVAAEADEVYLIVSGQALRLK